MMFLIFRDKAEIVKEYFVKKKNISIGADQTSDICIVHKMVSPKHCEILQLENGKIRVTDSKSTFGVFVNKRKIGSADINYGDTISIGPFEIECVPPDKPNSKKNERYWWYSLLCVGGSLRGKKYMLLKDSTKIGRDPSLNDIVISELDDTLASRRHATITKTSNGFVLSDKRSKNRTQLNRKVLEEEEEAFLKPYDEIVIGKQVFRFVPVTETALKPPNRIYPLWLRIFKSAFAQLIAVLIFCFACFFVYSGFLNLLIATRAPKEISFSAAKGFSFQTEATSPDSYLSPFISLSGRSSLMDIFLNSTISNLDTLLKSNIIPLTPIHHAIAAVSPAGAVYFDNRAKTPYRFNTPPFPCNSYPAFSDLNLDGIPDIVVHSGDSKLYVINGRTEDILFKSDILGPQLYSSPVVSRSRSTAISDIITCTQNGLINFIYKPLYNPRITSVNVDGSILASPILFHTKNRPEVGVASTKGLYSVYDIKTAKLVDSIDLRELTGIESLHISATPAYGDLNGDKSEEVIFISDNEYVIAVDYSSKTLVWKPITLETEPLGSFTGLHPSCVLSDIDGDGKLDIIAVSVKGKVYGIKGNTGEVLLQFDAGTQNRMACSPALADINKDGINEVLLGTEKGELYVLNFSNSQKESMQLFYGKFFNKPITNTPIVADADGDGYIDCIISSVDGAVAMLSSNVRTFSGYVYWPDFQGSPGHKGVRIGDFTTIIVFNSAVMSAAVLYILAFIFLSLFRKTKRRITWIG